MSPDSKSDASHVKEEIKEVEIIREKINEEDKIPIATLLQLHETSEARSEIKDAVGQGKYVKGTPVPADINVQLNANKDESLLDILNLGDIPQEESDAVGQSEIADTSTKKDLSNPCGPEELPVDKKSLRPYYSWMIPHPQMSENHHKPLVLKKPGINTILQIPMWFNLRRGFVRNLFASKQQ